MTPTPHAQDVSPIATEAIILGDPRLDQVRNCYMVQHIQFSNGNRLACASLVWAAQLRPPIVLYPAGIPLPSDKADGIFFEFHEGKARFDLLGYEAFHCALFGMPPVFELAQASATAFAVRDGRIVGWAAGEVRESCPMIAYTTEEAFDADKCVYMPALKNAIPVIDSVWVAEEYRDHGLASELISALADDWGTTPDQVAYGLPFTKGGFRLVRSVVGPRFYASTQGFVAMPVVANEIDKLGRPDSVTHVPDYSPEVAKAFEDMGAQANQLFDLSKMNMWPSPAPPRQNGSSSVRKQKPPRGKR